MVLRVAIGVPFRYGRGYGLGREGLYTAKCCLRAKAENDRLLPDMKGYKCPIAIVREDQQARHGFIERLFSWPKKRSCLVAHYCKLATSCAAMRPCSGDVYHLFLPAVPNS